MQTTLEGINMAILNSRLNAYDVNAELCKLFNTT